MIRMICCIPCVIFFVGCNGYKNYQSHNQHYNNTSGVSNITSLGSLSKKPSTYTNVQNSPYNSNQTTYPYQRRTTSNSFQFSPSKKPNVLFDWIDKYQKKSMGKVGPINTYRVFAKKRKQACKEAGILYPHDGARHSFGTYGYFEGGQAWAMRCMGHSNETTYKQYYLNTGIGPDEAKSYFSI